MVKSFGGIRASSIAAVARARCKTGTTAERTFYLIACSLHRIVRTRCTYLHAIQSKVINNSTVDALDIDASKSRCKLSDQKLFQWQCSLQLVTAFMNIHTFVLFIRKTPFVICILLLYHCYGDFRR